MEAQFTFGYWGIRGLGQYVRYVAEATGLKYNEKRYMGEEDWFKTDKPNLPVLLPNLPYFIQGDLAMSETDSIMRTIARLHKPELLGKTSTDQGIVEYIFSYTMKLNGKFRGVCYIKDVTEE